MSANTEKLAIADLSLLLKASSKEVVRCLCREAFAHRYGPVPDVTLATVAKTLEVEPLEANRVFSSAQILVSAALRSGFTDTESIGSFFPEGFHDSLKLLLSEIIAEDMLEWRSQVLAKQVSLPRLESFDWRVDVKISSNCAARMAAPTCLLEMKVHGCGESTDHLLSPQTVSMEFSRETLHTMLDGLGKIRDQLASVATK